MNNILTNIGDYNITVFTIINGKRCAAEISKFGDFESNDKIFYFNRLIVHESLRNQGIASDLMNKLIQILDTEKITLLCDVNPYGGLSLEQLILFYNKYGFIKDPEYNNNNDDQLIRYFKE